MTMPTAILWPFVPCAVCRNWLRKQATRTMRSRQSSSRPHKLASLAAAVPPDHQCRACRRAITVHVGQLTDP